jgi:hypothetical protein
MAGRRASKCSDGKKDVREAVVIAALSAMATGLIGWSIDEARRRVEAVRAKRRKKRK